MKKADANIWWIIIGAVIALVVLVVLLVIFTKSTGKLESGLSGCESKGGICVSTGSSCPQNSLKSSAFDCIGGKDCCLGAPKSCRTPADCGDGAECRSGYCYST